ncbi:MAG: hypothetical protein LBT45_03705 [Rickettsiales bacterium]|jgi:hypothetical protein|nr:hypothetical protein [Rickettsiales bacterium]
MLKKLYFLLLWSIIFAAAVALFFHVVFNFDIWSPRHWNWLAHATIRGLSGLAFGISLIAAVPVYVASAWFVWKNEKSPFNLPKLPVPKKAPSSPQAETAEPENKITFPEILPDELREPYVRAHSGFLTKNAVDFIKSVAQNNDVPEAETAPDIMMPLPDSFDAPDDSAPIFRDVDFDMESPVTLDEENGLKTATYVFDDTDFWIADDEDNWFATGKQIASPIRLLLEEDADKRILVLKTKNIMNMDALIPEWEKKGITVVRL